METIKWVLCPICGNKTRTIMQEDTELKNFPLYCPKCKQQTLVGASQSLCKPPNGCKIKLLSLEVIFMARRKDSPQKAAIRNM